MNDGVPGVVSARVACHGVEPLAQHVHNLALALVAPLGAEHYRCLRSHLFFASVNLPPWMRRFQSFCSCFWPTKLPAAAAVTGYLATRAYPKARIALRATFDSKPCCETAR